MSARNATIYLYIGVPFSSDLKHVVYYNSESARNGDLESYLDNTLTHYSFIDFESGTIKLNFNIENIDIPAWNYMIVYNNFHHNYGTCCFVTGTKYISDNCVQLFFTVDPWQTYVTGGHITFNTSFVERMHVSNDTIGAHTLAEPVPTGDPICINRDKISLSSANQTEIIVVAPWVYDDTNQNITHHAATESHYVSSINGVQRAYATGGVNYNSFPNNSNGYAALRRCFEAASQVNQAMQQIVSCYIAPISDWWSATTSLGKNYNASLNGHTVRNNKLYTFPYYFLKYGNPALGSAVNVRFENFLGGTCDFQCFSFGDIGGCNTMYPKNYENTYEVILNLGVNSPPYPVIPTCTDGYKSWVANNLIGSVTRGINTIATGAQIGASAGGVGAAVGALAGLGVAAVDAGFNIPREIAAGYEVSGGNGASMLAAWLTGGYDFYFDYMTLKRDALEAIDNFFDVYGYNVSCWYPIVMRRRNTHTFYKTKDLNISWGGNVPSSSAMAIKSAFNAGITIWTSLSTYGNYNLSNEPV